jgi:hypothetical protein
MRNGKPMGILVRKRKGTTQTVLPEVREWLRTYTKGHWYFFTNSQTNQLSIAFHNKQDALLWKLAWH